MSPLVNFHLVEDADGDEPDLDDGTCQCEKPDNQFRLEIEEGQVSLIHVACGKTPPASWGDWNDLVYMSPIPVRVEWEPNCDGSLWHGDHMCDCGASVNVTPPASEEAQQ